MYKNDRRCLVYFNANISPYFRSYARFRPDLAKALHVLLLIDEILALG